MPAPKPEKKLKRKFQFYFNGFKSGKSRDFILADIYMQYYQKNQASESKDDKRKEKI